MHVGQRSAAQTSTRRDPPFSLRTSPTLIANRDICPKGRPIGISLGPIPRLGGEYYAVRQYSRPVSLQRGMSTAKDASPWPNLQANRATAQREARGPISCA